MKQSLNKILAAVVFVIAFATYARTVAPTTSFWDCGEFIACSYIMGVMHPPGAPLYVILGRLFTLFPWGDVGWRVNMISVIVSAFTVMLLYLIIVRLIREWRGEPKSLEDKIITHAGGLIGALAFAFSDSFWFNAVEAEVYALSMFLTSLVVWLVLVWTENAQDYKKERLILVIVYLFGLATGVHLLSLLVFPTILVLTLFQPNQTVKRVTLIVALQLTLPVLLYILFYHYNPAALSYRQILQHQAKAGKFLLYFGLIVLITSLIYLYYRDRRAFKLWWFIPLLGIIGYSTYLIIFIRSGLDPAIDENDPETFKNLMAYLQRKQYGQESLLLTVFSRKAPFWEYQIKKMYIRYFGWQFIGKGTTLGADGYIRETISLNGLFGIPFIVGMIGVVHHFLKDWKRALAVLTLFLMTGIAIIIYLNQDCPQPRERDYAYVGSFFAFAIWVGIGVTALLESVADYFKNRRFLKKAGLLGCTALLALLVPVNMFRFNFDSHDRAGRYIAYDYSYNILQTCEKDAILFTNGDNDTFPLWFLQYVYNIRPDVRVVNLSLLNTPWYIKQLKHQEPRVPISLKDEQIERLSPILWEEKTIEVLVPEEVYQREILDMKKRGEFTGREKKKGKISFVVKPTLGKQGLRVQDLMILNIIFSNNWRKPIYFAITVSDENKIGLQPYLRQDGMAFKLIPFKNVRISPTRLRENLFKVFKFRGINDPAVYIDHKTKGLLINYRSGFIQLADHYLRKGQKKEALATLERMEEMIPEEKVPIDDYRISLQVGLMYLSLGKPEELERRLNWILARKNLTPNAKFDCAVAFFQYLKNDKKAEEISLGLLAENPDLVQARSLLVEIYRKRKEYEKGISLVKDWMERHPEDTDAVRVLEQLQKLKARKDSLAASKK